MASFNSSFSSFPPSPYNEEFLNLHHSIDSQLFRKLIIVLGRDITESMNVMAFWLWLEQQTLGGTAFVKRILSLPSNLINDLAHESVLCLKCMEKDYFSYPESAYELKFLPDILGVNVPLKFFFEHRTMVTRGMTMILSEERGRGFRDLNQNLQGSITKRESAGRVRDKASSSLEMALEKQKMQQVRVVNGELSDLFRNSLNLLEEEGNHVFPDDRTIFLTLFKGYYISEDEIRAFFTRTFGDFIEEIHMQPVSPGEPVLHARLVTRVASIVDMVVKGGTAEYYINGKYVRAQKRPDVIKWNHLSSSSEVTSAQ